MFDFCCTKPTRISVFARNCPKKADRQFCDCVITNYCLKNQSIITDGDHLNVLCFTADLWSVSYECIKLVN